MDPFVINRHGRIVFPCNFFPALDFSVFENLDQFTAVITRDFGEKSPTEHTITERLKAGKYKDRYTLCRDLALNLFWVNRYDFTMYEKRPIRWGDLARHRDDVFLPLCRSWDAPGTVEEIEAGYLALPVKWDEEIEEQSFRMLLRSFRAKPTAGSDLRAIKPTVAEMLAHPRHRTVCLTKYDPDYLGYSYDDVIDYSHPVPELEAVMRQAMILHNQYRWDPIGSCCIEVGKLQDDDYVVALYPRNNEVLQFIKRVKTQRKAALVPLEAAADAGANPPDRALRAHQCAQAVFRHAEDRGHRGIRRRDSLHQRRPHPQPRLLLVAHDRTGNCCKNRHRETLL